MNYLLPCLSKGRRDEGGAPGALRRLDSRFGKDLGVTYFRGIALIAGRRDIARRQGALGGCCQWVLDAAYQTVEWPRQPLRFESVILRRALDLISVICYSQKRV
jgi:hypothetical protein